METETEQQIHERMMYNVDDEHDKSPGGLIWDATMSAAIEFSTMQEEIDYVEGLMDVENLEDDDLTRFVYQRTGINRKPATRSVTTVIISGAVGSVITKGVLVSTDMVDFEIMEDAVVPDSGQVTVLASSVLYGVIGNIPSGAINRFPVTISGLVNVYNPDPVTNGYEAESDEDLRQRYYDKLQRPGKAGNKYHYSEWAKEVVGVGDARVVPRWNGPLTVKVIVINANKQPANEELVEEVFNYIESERPFGADVSVVGATGVTINITVNLSLVDGYTEELAIQNIKKNITRYLQDLAFKSPFVSYAKIGSEIIDSEGVLDYQNLYVNGGTANIPINEEEVAIMGGVNE